MVDHLNRRAFLARAFAGSAAVLAGTRRASAQATETDSLQKILASGKVKERYGQASEESIAAYERKYSTRFSDQYRAFLKRENGLRFSFEAKDENNSDELVLSDMNTFFGVGNGDKYNDLLIVTETMRFIRKKLLRIGPVIGVGGDFCTYVEICQGKYAGQIMYVDGEMNPEEQVGDRPIGDLPVDEYISQSITSGLYMPIASSFDDLLAKYARMA